ncbi:MAG: outer membrane lipoprotein carrier protein LolA [Planctomycetes bacterium]|nr:outer membrane lipoprotein carrier protein LolA [Planctomycetota bacterium]
MRPCVPLLIAPFMITALGTCVAVVAQDQAGNATSQPATAVDPTVDKILTRLEARPVHDLRARLTWKRTYAIEEEDDSSVKVGEIFFKELDPVPKFLVHFQESIVGRRKHELDEKHMFDGRWYVELQSKTKAVIRREVRREGDQINPYRIGEGPFPLPFGQKKSDMLREFAVTHIASTAADPPGTDHLQLVPRADTQTGQRYKTIDVWVAQEGKHAGLPTKVVTAKKDGTGKVNSTLTIVFTEIRLNEGFSASLFKIETPPGWLEEVETLDSIELPPGAGKGQPAAP